MLTLPANRRFWALGTGYKRRRRHPEVPDGSPPHYLPRLLARSWPGLLRAEMIGATLAVGRRQTAVTLSICVIDSPDAGTALIRQVLHQHHASPETRLIRHREPIPLD